VLASTGARSGVAVARVDVPDAIGSARNDISHLGDRQPGAYLLGQEAFPPRLVPKRPAAAA
jgi:hypothetical protein